MESYTIFLLNEKAKTYRYITFFILLFNCIAFGYIFFNTPDSRTETLSRFGLFLSFIYIVMYFVKNYTKLLSRFKLEISFIVLGILWLVLGKVAFALILILCTFLAVYSTRQQKVIFTKEKIIYPAFPPRTYLWNEVSNIVLKDDILTIDMKNNKLLQPLVIAESGSLINTEEFNDFCRTMLQKQ